jgi:L-rhamnose isomerase/sugar isomerase
VVTNGLPAAEALVDREALAAAQRAGDVLGANGVLMDALASDVRPLLAELRSELGLDPDPMADDARSGYHERRRNGSAAPRPAGAPEGSSGRRRSPDASAAVTRP